MDWHHFERMVRASTLEQVWRLASRFGRIHGFDNFSFVRSATNSPGATRAFLLSHSYPDGPYWKDRFGRLSRGEGLHADPVVMHILARQPPTAWNTRGDVAITKDELLPNVQKLVQRVRDFNLGFSSGITIPIYGPNVRWAYMGFTTPDTSELHDVLPHLASLHTFAHFADAALRRILGASRSSGLSRREKETLVWSAAGKSAWEIGLILSISEATVRFHFRNASRKLNVHGTRAAIAHAISIGEICP
jgi:DNA-binding CsgD family transcriptional regulator